MIFADKLIKLRKQRGWSQEELAERMDVSRQSVSKWESAQSMPDIERLLQLSKLFGVSLDYLLKDEIEDAEAAVSAEKSPVPIRRVTREDAERFLSIQSKNAVRMAVGVFLCIIAPFPLLLLGGAAESALFGITEELVASAGLPALLVVIAAAVALFVVSGIKNEDFEFLSSEPFKLDHDAQELVRSLQSSYRRKYSTLIAAAIVLCVLSPVPLFTVSLKSDFYGVCALCVMLLIIGAAVIMFVTAGTRSDGFAKLLKEGKFAEKTAEQRKHENLFGVYWLAVTAVYLIWSFSTRDWAHTWIVWVIAAVVYACIIKLLHKKDG